MNGFHFVLLLLSLIPSTYFICLAVAYMFHYACVAHILLIIGPWNGS